MAGISVQGTFVVEGLIPAINLEEFLVKSKPKRIIKPRHFEDFESANIVIKSVNNNSNLKRLHATVYM